MKKAIVILIALILVMILPCYAAGVSAGGGGGTGGMATPLAGLVTVQFSDVTIESDAETVSIDLCMTRNDGCTSIRFEVVYDEDILTLESVTDSGVFSGKNHSDNYTSPYILSWENDYARENITSTGTLATLNFSVDENTPVGNYPIQIKKYEILNTDIESLNCGIVTGFVRVVPPKAKLRVDNYIKVGNTATFDVSLSAPEGVFGNVVVAVYDAEGKMLSVNPYAAFSIVDNISVDVSGADHINVMWWDAWDINPFTKCETIIL